MIFLCSGGIGWRIFTYYQKRQRHADSQQEMNHFINVHEKLLQISIVDHISENETDVRKFLSLYNYHNLYTRILFFCPV